MRSQASHPHSAPAKSRRPSPQAKKTAPVAMDFDDMRSPILTLGDIQRDYRLLGLDLKSLPKSEADYDNRLRFMLTTIGRMQDGIKQLLKRGY